MLVKDVRPLYTISCCNIAALHAGKTACVSLLCRKGRLCKLVKETCTVERWPVNIINALLFQISCSVENSISFCFILRYIYLFILFINTGQKDQLDQEASNTVGKGTA